MTVNDFCTRWMYHYINEDFLKIPTKDNKYIRLQLGLGTYWLKQGGYGMYKEDFEFNGKYGFLFYKDKKNRIYHVSSDGFYCSFNNVNTDILIAYKYYNYYASSQFFINKSGDYYFLPQYSSSDVCSLSNDGTARAYRNNEQINYRIFQGASCYKITISDETIYRYGKKKSDAPIITSVLCYYYIPWVATQYLPDVRENYTGTYTLSREWVTKNNGYLADSADLWATVKYDKDGNEVSSFQNVLHSYDPEYQYKNFSITFTVSPHDFEYVENPVSSKTTPFSLKTHYNQLSNTITWNQSIEQGEVEGYYKTHQRRYDINFVEVFQEDWEHLYGIGVGKEYVKQVFEDRQGEGTIGLADVTTYRASVLQVDRDVQIVSTPQNIDGGFSGWKINKYYSTIHSYCGYFQEHPGDTEYRTWYTYDSLIYDGYSSDLTINSNYDGVLFVFTGVDRLYFRTPGGSASTQEYYSSPQIKDSYYVDGVRQISNFTGSILACPGQASLRRTDYTRQWGESRYWYNLGNDYCIFSEASISRNQMPGNYYQVITYSIYRKKNIDYTSIENWSVENFLPMILPENRQKVAWRMQDNIEYTYPPDSNWQYVYINEIAPVWDELSEEFKDYIGTGYIFCIQSAIEYCFNEDLIEDNLGQMLKTYPNPKDTI